MRGIVLLSSKQPIKSSLGIRGIVKSRNAADYLHMTYAHPSVDFKSSRLLFFFEVLGIGCRAFALSYAPSPSHPFVWRQSLSNLLSCPDWV